MAEELSRSVQFGLKLSRRIYYGKDQSPSAPRPVVMDKSRSVSEFFIPTGPMVYAVITEPSIVDNPDVPSYQPYVYGRCEQPALIPLHMHGIAMEVDCYMDTAFITVSGSWRVHCVAAAQSCDCRIAIPMGEKGSLLGVEIESIRKSYHSQLIAMGDEQETQKISKAKDGCLLKDHIYTLKVPEVDGGSNVFVKARWSQRLSFQNGQFCLIVPFKFPAHVAPSAKKAPGEKIVLNLTCGTVTELSCKSVSHPMKETTRQAGKISFVYKAKVHTWSSSDFIFSYSVSANDTFGCLLLQSPSTHDVDQRDMFCCYLFPGNDHDFKVFPKHVVFIVDISASMRGQPLENAKEALLAAVTKLSHGDSFNILAFSGNIKMFSSSMKLASKEAIENACEWIGTNFIAEGSTNMLLPLNQAMEMLAKAGDSIPLIFLITDGAVDGEIDICNAMKSFLADGRKFTPRICTFGIGPYCNHYFLQMLALFGRGFYDAVSDVDSIVYRMQWLINNASSIILANMTIDALENLDSLELYPLQIPDLVSGSPLVISGRYCGNFPDIVRARGVLADFSSYTIDLKVQKTEDFPIDRIFARRHIDMLTAQAWFSRNTKLKEKVTKMSLQLGFSSEYTRMILVQNSKGKQTAELVLVQKQKNVELDSEKTKYLRHLGVGFGSLVATSENLPPTEELKLEEHAEMMMKAASNCCSSVLDRCCCMCFIQTCSKLNNQCAIVFTQLCTALACFECLSFCCEVCFSCDDLC